MLLNREIGSEYGMIDGAIFQQELLELDEMGKKRIQVWINCPGGEVFAGYGIFNAILKSKTPVDTYNVGIAASMAGAIFMAGRNRYMADYARLMMHPVGGAGDSKAYEALMSSISTMLESKSKCTPEEVQNMMTATTWLTSSQAFEKGFCTDIENTNTSNTKYAKKDATALWNLADQHIKNSLKLNTTSMKKVTNLLNLNDDATEDSIVSAVNLLTEAKNAAIADKEALQAELTDLQAKAADIQAQLDAANTEVQTAKETAATNNAKALVATFTAKIGNKAEDVARWESLAKNDLEGTKALLESLPLNVKADAIHTEVGSVDMTAAPAGGFAQAEMIKIQNNLKTQN